jgi:hypothetical protein
VQAPPKSPLANTDEKNMQMALDSLAAEVYSNVHERLLSIQQQQLNEANAVASEVRRKLDPLSFKVESACAVEEKELLSCLQNNKSNPLACSTIVAAFEKCSKTAAIK